MAVLEIVDQCLFPETVLTMSYSGHDPWGVAKKISGGIKPFFHVSSSGTGHDQLNWDISDDPIKFYSKWWVKRNFSRFSYMRVEIKVQGFKSKTTNNGDFRLELRAAIYTNFSGNNIFLKTLWVLYSYMFYNRQRRAYIETCKNMVFGYRNEIKRHFNLKTAPLPHSRGAMG